MAELIHLHDVLVDDRTEAKLIAAVLGRFGNLIQQFPFDSRRLNIELAFVQTSLVQAIARDMCTQQHLTVE